MEPSCGSPGGGRRASARDESSPRCSPRRIASYTASQCCEISCIERAVVKAAPSSLAITGSTSARRASSRVILAPGAQLLSDDLRFAACLHLLRIVACHRRMIVRSAALLEHVVRGWSTAGDAGARPDSGVTWPSTIGALDTAVDFGDWAVQDASRRQRRRCHRGGSGHDPPRYRVRWDDGARASSLPRQTSHDRADHEEAREGMTGGRRPPTWSPCLLRHYASASHSTRSSAANAPARRLSDGWPGAGMVCAILARHNESWPCKSNPVRLGFCVSRALARREIAGFRPGFWPQGQLRHPSSLGAQPRVKATSPRRNHPVLRGAGVCIYGV